MLGAGAPDQGIVELGHHAVVDLAAEVLQQCASSVTGQDDGICKVWLGADLLGVHPHLHTRTCIRAMYQGLYTTSPPPPPHLHLAPSNGSDADRHKVHNTRSTYVSRADSNDWNRGRQRALLHWPPRDKACVLPVAQHSTAQHSTAQHSTAQHEWDKSAAAPDMQDSCWKVSTQV